MQSLCSALSHIRWHSPMARVHTACRGRLWADSVWNGSLPLPECIRHAIAGSHFQAMKLTALLRLCSLPWHACIVVLICRFAMEEAVFALVRIFQRFTLQLSPAHHMQPLEANSSITLAPVGGVWVTAHARSQPEIPSTTT